METIIATLLGGLLALAGGWFAQRSAAKSENRKWLRDQKVKIYADFVTRFKTTTYLTPQGNWDPDPESFHENLDRQLAPLAVLGATEVIEKIRQCAKEELAMAIRKSEGTQYPSVKKFNALVLKMTESMNKDLSV